MTKLPFGTYEVYLESYGFYDHTNGWGDNCAGVKLMARTPERNIEFWDSGLYDMHPDEYAESMELIKKEVVDAFAHYSLNVVDIIDFDSDCVWDWEYDQNVGV